jgi:dTDP-4-dehydrorhamnose 3,5-epimerase
MHTEPLPIPEVVLIRPQVFSDARGFFLEAFHAQRYASLGLSVPLVQDNLSGSQGGVLRGLHYQIQQAQGKLVSVLQGTVFDVAVDLRRSSPTFGQWVGTYLSSEEHTQLWIPAGFAHGFYVVSRWALVAYKVTDFYSPQWERTLRWDDPAVGIAWPLADGAPPVLSAKDAQGRLLAEADVFD